MSSDADVAGFRRVLHEWARRQLEQRSDHVGPFEIIGVEMEKTSGSSVSSSETWVHIYFQHDGRSCPDSWKRYYTPTGAATLERCTVLAWFMPDTQTTVAMLNELLAIAARSDQ